MSTHMRARLAELDTLEPLIGYRVILRGPATLFGSDELASEETVSSGQFSLDYRRDPSTPGNHRSMELVVKDHVGRILPFAGMRHVPDRFVLDPKSGRIRFPDVDDEQVIEGDFLIRKADATGYAVTLGTGDAERVSSGNRVTVFVDKDAFQQTADRMRAAQDAIVLTQYTFSLPAAFNADPSKEVTRAVFDFHPPEPSAQNLRATDAGDARPERLLLDAARRGVNVRILLHSFTVPLFLKIALGVILFPFAGTDGIFGMLGRVDEMSSADEAKEYFDDAAEPNLKVQPFPQPLMNMAVMHARLAFFDRTHAICMGSSYFQGYVDTHDHAIDAPVRGSSSGYPNHDAGIEVTGPAVADLHDTMDLLWNTAAPNDPLPPPRPAPSMPAGTHDAVCAMQIVRTLSADTFDSMEKGEKGILEAYLRAIANAKDFIYLETQYFTNDRIGEALVEIMNKERHRPGKPDLQVIVVLNIQPDTVLYPFKQRRLITRIREAIGQTPDTSQQFGVFTRWTHEVAHPRPRILPIYVHSKLAIVDDSWATVGSANLDGVSLDSFKVTDIANKIVPGDPFREARGIEVNALLFNGVDGHPESEIVDILRRKLWAEHLGYSLARDEPDPNADDLSNRPEAGWLKLWIDRATDTLEHLRTTPALPTTGMARVLPWPLDDCTHKTPRDHLTKLGIKPHALVPLKSTRKFDFRTGQWDPNSKAEMDY